MLKLDARTLLTIDVSAEVQKLAGAQADGGSRLPVELVRLLARGGAREISVRLGRSGLRVFGEGARLEASLLSELAALLDEGAPGAQRHRALLRLEAEAPGLLALAALAGARLLVETNGVRLGHAPAEPPEVTEARTGDGTRIEVEGLRVERVRARSALEAACRFLSVRTTVDRREIHRGFEDSLAQMPLPAPLQGAMALPARGETTRVFLLRGGVVAAHLNLPVAPCFEAALELGDGGESASQLREAALALLPSLVTAALELLRQAAERMRVYEEPEQRRLRHQLLAAARRHRHASAALKLPLFPGYVGREPHRFSLLDLAPLREGVVLALHPGQDLRRFVAGQGPILVLDAQERSLLAELLDLRFAPPPPRPDPPRFGRPLRQALEWFRRLLAWRWAPPPVAEDHMSLGERALLAALRESGVPSRLADGAGPVLRRAGVFRIPRRNPVAAACGRLLERDPSWGYAAALALLGDRGGNPQKAPGRR